MHLYMNTLILGAVWHYVFPGAYVHSTLSMFLRLLHQWPLNYQLAMIKITHVATHDAHSSLSWGLLVWVMEDGS